VVFAQSQAEVATVPWDAHPEVWILVLGAAALAWFASRVVEPKAVAAGFDPISRGQKLWYLAGVLGMWAASDWPIHDIAEDHLYAVHMFQHMLISTFLPAAFVLATPRWLLELVLGTETRLWRWFATVSRPLFAGITFNAVALFLHWSAVVELSSSNGAAHFVFHVAIFSAGLLMWQPVISAVTEWRLPPMLQCLYLFSMSIIPTIPGAWLLFAEGVVYPNYDTPDRLFGISVVIDQQAAGLVMKLLGGFVLWLIIVFIFAKWAIEETDRDRQARLDRTARDREAQDSAEASEALSR